METVVLVVHLMIVTALVVLVLLQRNEGGALGIGGGGNFLASRSTGNVLTRATTWLAIGFFATSIFLTFLAQSNAPAESILGTTPTGGILDAIRPEGAVETPVVPNDGAAGGAPAVTETPVVPNDAAPVVPNDAAPPVVPNGAAPVVPNGAAAPPVVPN